MLMPSDADQFASVYVQAAFMAVIPAQARKHADVLRNLLFPVQPKAVLAAVGERGGRDGRSRSLKGRSEAEVSPQHGGRHGEAGHVG